MGSTTSALCALTVLLQQTALGACFLTSSKRFLGSAEELSPSPASGPTGGQVTVASGRELALAIADPSVTLITLATSLRLADADWDGLGSLPLNLTRNVTVSSTAESQQSMDWPAIDFNFVKEKIRLLGGVQLTLHTIVLTRYREDIPSSTPGMDLLTRSILDPALPPAMLLWDTIALNNPLCFPANVSRQSVLATPRPPFWPGVQNVTTDLPQPGCINSTTAPWLQRCWPIRRHYYDIGTAGAAIGVSGRPEPTNYYVHALDTPLLCSAMMPQECINRLGAFACYYSIFPRVKTPPSPIPPSPAPPPSPEPAAPPAVSSTPGARRELVGGLVGGLLGGGLLLAAAAAVLLIRRRRWSRTRGSRYKAAGPPNQPAHEAPVWTATPWAAPGGSTQPGLQESAETHCKDTDTRAILQLELKPEDTGINGLEPGGSSPNAARLPGGLQAQRPLADKREGGADAAAPYSDSASQVNPDAEEREQLFAQEAGAPVTAMTPPRSDLQLLREHEMMAGNEVQLLPNATRGKGCFGRVVEGVYQGRRVAVKLVSEAHVWGGLSQSLLRSFAQEVEVLGRCDHPNVVRLLAACLTPPRLCLVMELMEISLEQLLYTRPGGSALPLPLPLPLVLHIALEIAKGLEYLHPTIVHRDLKPANVLLNDPWGSKPVVKLTDFGLARLRMTTRPTETPGAGTPAYIAPEGFNAANNIITHQFDIYSLAVLLWEMLAGVPPWRGCAVMEVAFKVVQQAGRPPLGQLPPERCPPRLRSLITQCWEADPRRRPAAAEVVKGLALVLQEVETSSSTAAYRLSSAGGLPPPPGNASPLPLATAEDAPNGNGASDLSHPRVLNLANLDPASAAALAAAAMTVQPETIGSEPAGLVTADPMRAVDAAANLEAQYDDIDRAGVAIRVVAVGVNDLLQRAPRTRDEPRPQAPVTDPTLNAPGASALAPWSSTPDAAAAGAPGVAGSTVTASPSSARAQPQSAPGPRVGAPGAAAAAAASAAIAAPVPAATAGPFAVLRFSQLAPLNSSQGPEAGRGLVFLSGSSIAASSLGAAARAEGTVEEASVGASAAAAPRDAAE